MASITFNDGASATLDNGLTGATTAAASRFSAWTPWTRPIGPQAVSLATGAVSQYRFRTDYGASFELREIPNTTLPTALRLIRHLMGGGTCSVTTGDVSSHVYATCGLAPDFEPKLTLADPVVLTYTLSLSLINLGAAADLRCEY